MSRNAHRSPPPNRLPGPAFARRLMAIGRAAATASLPRLPWARGNRALLYAAAALLLLGAGAGLGRLVGARTRMERGHQGQRAVERAALWQALQEARRARDWSRCIDSARQLLQLPPAPGDSHERVQQILEQALEEQQNLLVYDRFLQAVARRAPDAAVLAYSELPANSVYRELGAVRYQEARSAFVRLHTEQALREAKQLGCQAAQPHLDAVAAVDPEAAVTPELAT
ncbi:MAG: hypothetical protein RMK29_20515, partial [Myxococcales bacterium]|nr:hypothetical protein [Myxococcales bacterium]